MVPGRWQLLLAVPFLVAIAIAEVLAAPLDLGAPGGAEATARVGPRADRYDLPTAAFTRSERPVLGLRGSVIWNAYRLDDPEVTVAAVAEGYRALIRKRGFEVLLDCAARDCGGFDFRFGVSLLPAPAMRLDVQNFEQISIRRADDEAYASILISRVLGAIYVQIVTVEPSEAVTTITKAPVAPETPTSIAPERPDDLGLMEQLTKLGHVQLDGLEFATGGSQLAAGSATALDRIAALLTGRPELKVVIVGHSDNEGGLDANIALSRSRANAVLEALVARGVPKARLEARGIGFLSPLMSNATPEGRARNRRVEIVISE